jgi:hypothetical protein
MPEMCYFGERWDAPILDDAVEVEVPVGVPCMFCEEPFEEGDSGWVYASGQPTHTECGLRSVLGGVNHQLGLCSCCGGTLPPDPPGLSRREAAQAALKLHLTKGQG